MKPTISSKKDRKNVAKRNFDDDHVQKPGRKSSISAEYIYQTIKEIDDDEDNYDVYCEHGTWFIYCKKCDHTNKWHGKARVLQHFNSKLHQMTPREPTPVPLRKRERESNDDEVIIKPKTISSLLEQRLEEALLRSIETSDFQAMSDKLITKLGEELLEKIIK